MIINHWLWSCSKANLVTFTFLWCLVLHLQSAQSRAEEMLPLGTILFLFYPTNFISNFTLSQEFPQRGRENQHWLCCLEQLHLIFTEQNNHRNPPAAKFTPKFRESPSAWWAKKNWIKMVWIAQLLPQEVSFSRLVTPILKKHRWETRPELGILARSASPGHPGMEKSAFYTCTGSKSPPNTSGHWEHLSIHNTHTHTVFFWGGQIAAVFLLTRWENVHWGVSSRHFHIPFSACLEGKLSSQPAMRSTFVFDKGWNQQSATRFPQVQSQIHRDHEIWQYKNVWEYSVSKVLKMGVSFPPSKKWVEYL